MFEAGKAPAEASGASDHRCVCGSLLARVLVRGVELKCRRCKRVVLIPWGAHGAWQEVAVPCAPARPSELACAPECGPENGHSPTR